MQSTGTTRAVMNFVDGNSSVNNGFGCIGNNHVFMKDGNEKIRIDSSGVLRVGNTHNHSTSGNTKRIALGAKGSIWGWTSGNINGAITLADNYYWTGTQNIAIENDHSAYLTLRSGNLRFGTTNQTHSAGAVISGGIHEKFRIETNGNATINDGDLVIGTAGHGIDFSAQTHPTAAANTTVNAELLDHYERGTFQPILKRLMTNNTTETNFYNQGTRQGNYIRIGNRVWITGRIHWSGGSTGSGSLIMVNFPYTPANNGANEVPITVGYRNGFNYNNLCGYMAPGLNRFFVQWSDTNASHNISPSACNSSGTFYFALNYQL